MYDDPLSDLLVGCRWVEYVLLWMLHITYEHKQYVADDKGAMFILIINYNALQQASADSLSQTLS